MAQERVGAGSDLLDGGMVWEQAWCCQAPRAATCKWRGAAVHLGVDASGQVHRRDEVDRVFNEQAAACLGIAAMARHAGADECAGGGPAAEAQGPK